MNTDLLWWLAVVIVMAVGLIGTVLPVIPGTTIILTAAVVHRTAARMTTAVVLNKNVVTGSLED